MDLNGDGNADLLGASFDGSPHIAYGNKKGFSEPEALKDAQGRRIILSTYYDHAKREYAKADRSPKGSKNPDDHLVSVFAWDWDADGDLDLILGAKSPGRLYLQLNNGTAKKPSFTGVNRMIKSTKDTELRMATISAPHIDDWDGDGLDDILCGGNKKRNLIWYRNVGKKGAPKFEKSRALLTDAGPRITGTRLYLTTCDLDGDGIKDLLVGNEGAGMMMGGESPSTGLWYFRRKPTRP